MSTLPYVVDGTAETFSRLVLENSRKGLVAANFWSPRAGPCLVLMPRLVRVAREYGGRFLLVMIDTDQYGELAVRLHVRALPLLCLFRGGEIIDRLQGVVSEVEIRTFFGKHLPGPEAVMHAHVAGDTARAARLAAEDALSRPDDPLAALRVAKLLVLDKRPAEAFALLDALPPALQQGEIADLHAHLALMLEAARKLPPDDARLSESEQIFHRAACAAAGDDYETACRELLACAATDPDFRSGLAHRCAHALGRLPLPQDVRQRLHALLETRP